jgi:ribosomal protection tetracycline resistance protein
MHSLKKERVPLVAEQRIVVDGYNVIYADDELRPIAIKDMERARREFLARIADYLIGKELQVTVVFDGRGGLTDAETIVPRKLQAVYSAQGQSADELIVSMVATSRNPKSYIVVTSDRAHIQPAVAGCGCRVIGSKAFLERLSRKPRRSTREGAGDKPHMGADDTDYWLDRFENEADGDE